MASATLNPRFIGWKAAARWSLKVRSTCWAQYPKAAYVGHAMVTNTYWYLSAVPELMALAAERFETFTSQSGVRHA